MSSTISHEDYEKALLEKLTLEFPPPLFRVSGTREGKNFYIRGRNSGRKRQIDGAVYRVGEDAPIFIADAKRHGRALDITDIDSFVGFLDDVGCNHGLLAAPRETGRPARDYAEKKNIKIHLLTYAEALVARWLDVARGLVPYDWAFHPQMAEAIESIVQKKPASETLDAIAQTPFDEWLAFVKYALARHRDEAVGFLFFQLENHWDYDIRVATVSWMLDFDVLTVEEARELESMFFSPKHLLEFREILREHEG